MRYTLLATMIVVVAITVGCSKDSPLDPTGPADLSNDEADVASTGFDALVAAQKDLDGSVLGVPGITGTGIGLGEDGQLKVVVLVEDEAAKAAVPALVGKADVEVRVTGLIKAFAVYPGRSTSNDNQCAAGTIAAAVTRNGSGGGIWWLSNNHVFARENNAALGESLVYPGRYDANCGHPPVIGTLSAFEPIRFNGQPNRIDAAIALMRAGTAWSSIINGGGHSYRPTNNVQAPQVGLQVKKIGRTTLYTTGTIILVNASVNVWYDSGVALFTGQMVTTAGFSAAGDSGSLVSTTTSNNPVGLLFAGSSSGTTIVNPIQPILTRFNIRFVN